MQISFIYDVACLSPYLFFIKLNIFKFILRLYHINNYLQIFRVGWWWINIQKLFYQNHHYQKRCLMILHMKIIIKSLILYINFSYKTLPDKRALYKYWSRLVEKVQIFYLYLFKKFNLLFKLSKNIALSGYRHPKCPPSISISSFGEEILS